MPETIGGFVCVWDEEDHILHWSFLFTDGSSLSAHDGKFDNAQEAIERAAVQVRRHARRRNLNPDAVVVCHLVCDEPNKLEVDH